MGTINHRVMIVVSHGEHAAEAHAKALEMMTVEGVDCLVSPLQEHVNGVCTFMIATTGSKVGWGIAEDHEERLREFAAWLETKRYEDNSTPYDWAIVMMPDDQRMRVQLEQSS